jgi:hypothetical protein
MAEAATGDVKASADLAESSRTPEPADTSSSEHEVGSESDERLEPQSNDRIALTISKRTLKWVGAMSVVVVLAGAAGYGVAQVTSSTSSRSNRAEPQTTTTVAPVSSTQTPPTTGSVTTPPPAVSQPRGANLACDRSALLRVLYRDAPSSESPLPPNLSPESPPVCLTVQGTRYAAERFLWPGQSNIVGIFEPSADGGTWTLMTGWGDSCLGLVPDQIRGAFLPSGIC